MRTRTNLRAGDDALQACKQEKEYWMAQAEKMESILASCSSYKPPAPPPSTTTTSVSCGWINGVYYPDMSGSCG